MRKYWVVNDCEPKTFKEIGETAAAIEEERSVGLAYAPDIYMMLWVYTNDLPLEYDETTEAGNYINIGIDTLNDMGYIEIGGECEDDDYKMIWIMK